MINSLKNRINNNKTKIWLVLFIISVISLFVKAKYGFGKKDEPFYILLSYRLWQGDSLFFDEQHLSQLFSFLTYPLMVFYMKIFKNTDGILLNFRYIYLFFQSLTSIFIYYRLKKLFPYGAIVSSLVFLFYCPYNLMALSYNTICIMLLTISLLLFCTNKNNIELVLSGLCFAACVLCNPYLIILYFVFTIFTFYYSYKKINDYIFNTKTWTYISLGCFVLAFLFVSFVLSRCSINKIIESIPYILNDTQYPYTPVYMKVLNYFSDILTYSPYVTVVYLIMIAVTLFFVFDRNKKIKKDNYIKMISILLIIILLLLFITKKSINVLLFPMNILCSSVYLIYYENDKTYSELFKYYVVPSIFYSMCINLSSDTGFPGISSAFIVPLVVNIPIIVEHLKKNKTVGIFAVKLFVVLLIIESFIYVYNGQLIVGCNKKITDGSHKGVVVHNDYYDAYYSDLNKINHIRKYYEGDSILILSDHMWMYLIASDYKIASPSSWKTIGVYLNTYVNTLDNYYAMNPNKKPDIILVDEKYKESVTKLGIIDGYSVHHDLKDSDIYDIRK